jgi:hypothetical protein
MATTEAQNQEVFMMNVDNRILMEAIESRTRQEMRDRERSQYPDDYWDADEAVETVPLRPEACRITLQPDELALHQKLLEIAKADSPVPTESFFG